MSPFPWKRLACVIGAECCACALLVAILCALGNDDPSRVLLVLAGGGIGSFIGIAICWLYDNRLP